MPTTTVEPSPSPVRSTARPARIAALVLALLAGWWSTGLDVPVHDALVEHRPGPVTTAMKVVTHLGSPVTLAALAVLTGVVVFLRTRRRLFAAVPLIAPALAGVAELTLKQVVGRVRPPVAQRLIAESGPSFPSGHATVAAALLTTVALLAPVLVRAEWVHRVQVSAVAAFVLIGASRLYLGVHWPVDVFCGWAIGGAIGLGTWALFRPIDPAPR